MFLTDILQVFAQVTAVISETVLRHSCLSPSQLCDRLQLETGVSCDSHTGDLTLLGSWDQLEKARQLIRKCSLGNKTTKSKTRTVAPSEMLHGTTKVCFGIFHVTISVLCYVFGTGWFVVLWTQVILRQFLVFVFSVNFFLNLLNYFLETVAVTVL